MYKILLPVLCFICLASCTSTRPHQPGDPIKQRCSINDEGADSCAGTYYREYDNYDLGFIEYSERGNAFNTDHLKNVLARVESKAVADGVITVVFVHGWLNNAQEENRNLQNFRKVLNVLAEGTRKYGADRRVVGLFVGWRGASFTLPGLRMLTFWNRKNVAQNLGSGALTRLLLELDRIKRVKVDSSKKHRNHLITVGHSFGGAIVLSAVKDVLLDRLIATKNEAEIVPGIGDEVVLLNPAVEANQILPLVDVARDRQYQDGQNTILTIISTDEDTATHIAFPAGQLFGTLARHKQEDLEREWYVDRNTKEPVALREEDLDGITVGNYAPFLTHRITLRSSDGENAGCTRYAVARCALDAQQCRAKGWNRTAPYESISELPTEYPLRFLKTNRSIMRGHSDIFGTSISILLRGLIESRLTPRFPWKNDEEEWNTLACPD